jgi:hypothetical protein
LRRAALAGKGAAAYTEGTGLFVSAYVSSAALKISATLFVCSLWIKTIGLLKTIGIEHVVVDSVCFSGERHRLHEQKLKNERESKK